MGMDKRRYAGVLGAGGNQGMARDSRPQSSSSVFPSFAAVFRSAQTKK